MADEEHPASSPEGESTEALQPDSEASAAAPSPQDAAEGADAEGAAQTPVESRRCDAPGAAADAPLAAPRRTRRPEDEEEEEEELAPREKPSVPGAHLEVDIVPEGVDPLGGARGTRTPTRWTRMRSRRRSRRRRREEEEQEEVLAEPIATAAIDLASGARYRATGKRKSAIARVTLRPGTGSYLVNGRTLEEHFPRLTLQRNIRQPLETVGYQDRMDVVARLHGGGISAQAGALRHGVSRALLEADPNLRGELKRRGFLTRDSRAKERKKAGLKKARKRPQFSKR